ncbi:hypothetical protein AB5I41_16115 [Sphingomonas sp. MMS24-JH45]
MIEGFWIVAAPVGVALILAAIIRRVRPTWSRRRGVLAAAAPVPLLVAVAAIYVIVSAATSSEAECGVDACGMATMAAAFMLACALAAFVLGAIAAAAILREGGRDDLPRHRPHPLSGHVSRTARPQPCRASPNGGEMAGRRGQHPRFRHRSPPHRGRHPRGVGARGWCCARISCRARSMPSRTDGPCWR